MIACHARFRPKADMSWTWINRGTEANVRIYLALVLMLISVVAAASEDFDKRVAIAKALENTPQGQAYVRVLYGAIGDYVQKTMFRCFPSDKKADTERFTLVADILANGKAARVQVQPETEMSGCFRAGFSSAPFPELPGYAKGGSLPIFINVKIIH